MALAAAEDEGGVVVGVIDRNEMHEGVVVQVWEVEDGITLVIETRITGNLTFLSTRVGVVLEDGVGIVVVTIVAAEDGIDAALDVFHVGGGQQHLCIKGFTRSGGRRVVPRTLDGAAEVVAAVDVVANPREAAVVADVDFRGTVDVCVAGTAEGIIDTTVAEIDVAVAEDVAFATAAVDVFGLCQGQALLLFRVAGIGALQVHRAGVVGIIGLASFVARLADNTFLATAEDLEGVAVVQVHRGAAPDLCVCTITGTEHRHGNRLHVVALRLDEHTRTAVAAAFDFIRVAGICLGKQHVALV